jgi:hypothetical protein
MLDRSIKRLSKKARRGMRGYPIGVVACYGPDDKRASKLVASVQLTEDAEQIQRKWFAETGDLRKDPTVALAILTFFEEHGVLTVGMPDRIIGCPHEEGIDYEGEYCPRCAFWIGRDRWTGKLVS